MADNETEIKPSAPPSYLGLKARKRKREADSLTSNNTSRPEPSHPKTSAETNATPPLEAIQLLSHALPSMVSGTGNTADAAAELPTSAQYFNASANSEPSQGNSGTTSAPSPISRYAPERKTRKKNKEVNVERKPIDIKQKVPDWYGDVERTTSGRSDQQSIADVKRLIANCIEAQNIGGLKKGKAILDLRDYLHKMALFEFVKLAYLKQSKVLEDKGLRAVFDGPDKGVFPRDIQADAKALWLRWWVEDVDGSMFRGTTPMKNTAKETGTSRISHRLEANYPFKKSSNVVGQNGLCNGQWWPMRICALRDGAHGAQEAGIHGQTDDGAYSIVLSSGGYADKDRGEVIEYCGTESETNTPSKGTSLLQVSFANQQRIRVLRAVNKESQYAPEKGLRYDGLYIITNEEILNEEKFMARFTLQRVEGQDPIRYKGDEARPNKYELLKLAEYETMIA